MAPTRLTRQSQTHIKQNNLRVVLDQVIWNEPLSRADIVRLTHISKPTVSGLVNELLRRKIVAEIGAGKSKGGRKPILLCFEKSRKYLLAFEMGRVGYRIALSNLKGDIRHKKKGEFSLETTFSRRLMFMKDAIKIPTMVPTISTAATTMAAS